MEMHSVFSDSNTFLNEIIYVLSLQPERRLTIRRDECDVYLLGFR
jgi:hypothetical protein